MTQVFSVLIQMSYYESFVFLADLGKCPNGWEERVGSNQCYLITDVHDMRTRDDASAQCQLQQGQLVKIDSIAERVIIFQPVSYSTWVDPWGGGVRESVTPLPWKITKI